MVSPFMAYIAECDTELEREGDVRWLRDIEELVETERLNGDATERAHKQTAVIEELFGGHHTQCLSYSGVADRERERDTYC